MDTLDTFDFDESIKMKLGLLEQLREANGDSKATPPPETTPTEDNADDDEKDDAKKKRFHTPLDMFAENSDMFNENTNVRTVFFCDFLSPLFERIVGQPMLV